MPGGALNKAYECLDRHAKGERRDKLAMLWEGKNGEQETYTFAEFNREANKAANGLRSLGVEKGDRVFMFLERIPECYFTAFGDAEARRCHRPALLRLRSRGREGPPRRQRREGARHGAGAVGARQGDPG